MAKNDEKFVEALADEATEQLQSIKAYRTYQGNNPDYGKRAKLAIGVIGAYVKLRGTIANERSNELITIKLIGADGEVNRKALSGSR